MGAISKAVKKIIPKEIQPILPFAASMFGGPLIGSTLGLTGTAGGIFGSGVGGKFLGKALTGGLTNLATQGIMGGKISPRSALLSSLISGGGGFLRNDLAETAFGKKLAPSTLKALQGVGQVLDPAEITTEGYSLTGTGEGLSPITRPGYAALTVGGAEAAYQTAEEEQRKFEEEQAASEASQQADMASRAEYLRNYAELAGYSQEEIDDLLDRYGYSGYRMGGRVGYRIGGSTASDFLAKFGIGRPDYDSLMRMFEQRKKEIFNSMFDPEAGTGAYSMEQMQQADEMATKQATQELNEYMEKIGMDLLNPPEGSMEDEMINQIMEPREANQKTTFKTPMENIPMAEMISLPLKPSSKEPLLKLSDEEKEEYIEELNNMDEFNKKFPTPEGINSILERLGFRDGGMMNLKMGGMPAEMDLRGGGFVPIGRKERADDVPARLSKNEFVMTADAVRAAGGGSVNKGAKRMYDLMNKLEARV